MPRTITEVAPGVHLLSAAYVNCYLIADDSGVTLVDTGLPRMWSTLTKGLAAIGRRPEDLRGVVITHAHFDHIGCARRLARTYHLPVWAHPSDHYLAAHPYRYEHERPRALYPVRYPRAVRILGTMAAAGAWRVRGVGDLRTLTPDQTLDVPGRPRVVFTPGHTAGHCALHLPERDALITGDALVTLDPYTGHRGPQIVARAATADSRQAFASLTAIAATSAAVLLPGHGEPWREGAEAAVEVAQHRPAR